MEDDGAALNPLQQRVIDELLDRGRTVPRLDFPPDLHRRLRKLVEEELQPTYELLATGGRSVWANKGSITRVLQCERHFELGRDSFEWSLATARGTLAHRAVELGLFDQSGASPIELVDAAVDRVVAEGGDRSPALWLESLDPGERAQMRAEVSDIVTAFQDCFPPVPPRWRPRVESPVKVELFGGHVVLQAKVDLGLGRAEGKQARAVIIDIKTGRPSASHIDELRFYALLEAMKIGVPPFRVASLYLDSGTWHHEDITEGLLEVAARRVVGAVRRLADLELRTRPANISAGPQCSYCEERDTCPGAAEWAEIREQQGLDPATF